VATNPEGADVHPVAAQDPQQEPGGDGGSAFERIGGAATVRLAVDELYKLILSDPDLQGYFEGVELSKLKVHMVDLLTTVLGGPGQYTGRELADAHRDLEITEEHYRKVGAYLIGILQSAGAPEDVVASVGGTLEAVSDQIIEVPSAGSTPGGPGLDG
jgi:hemoglobin